LADERRPGEGADPSESIDERRTTDPPVDARRRAIEAEMAASLRGVLQDGWHTEEDFGAVRLGLKVDEVLHRERSPFQEIAVYRSDFFGKILVLDGLVMLTERDEFVYHEMLTHVPLTTLEDPRRVLVIGGGDLGCVREVLKHDSVEQVVLCEIDRRVTEVCRDHFPWVGPALDDPRLQTVFGDGVAYVREHPGRFDLVIVDSTDPVGPAVGLFLREFYREAAKALRPGGVLTAQTESPHYSPRLVRRIYTELRAAFTHVDGYLGFIPTYPSGCWSWAWASSDHRRTDFFDRPRAERIARDCHYYDPEVHEAAFALPGFARRAIDGGTDLLDPPSGRDG